MATYTLEDGSGKSDATAYASLAEVNAYINNYVRNSSTWTSLSDSDKQNYIVEASQSVDLLWGERFVGYRTYEAQALQFPRTAGYDTDGYAIAGDEVPIQVKRATAEMAWRHLNGSGPSTTTGDSTDIIADTASGKNISEEEVSAGSVSTKTKYNGEKSIRKYYRKIELILAPLLEARAQMVRA